MLDVYLTMEIILIVICLIYLLVYLTLGGIGLFCSFRDERKSLRKERRVMGHSFSFKDTFLHMFVKDKVEQKPKEELSTEELQKMSDWLLKLHNDCERELERRRS